MIVTQGLFLESSLPSRNREYAKWTLKDDDYEFEGKLYPSLKKIYLEMEDPHEYEFVMATIGDWNIWERLCEAKFFKKHVEKWRKELDAKLKSKAFSKMKAAVQSGTASHQTMKYLAANEYREKEPKRGRPSKAEIEATKKELVKADNVVSADAERIGLRVVK